MGTSTAFEISDSDDDLETILSLLSSKCGIDFTLYRRSTLKRRVRLRMERSRMQTIDAYIQFVKDWPAELDALSEDVLTKVTPFFRDPKAFEVLKAEAYPALCVARAQNTPIRVWVPGCSTGEEVYSLAISLLEALSEWQLSIPIQIFATDISAAVIAKARAGVYGHDIAHSVTKQRLARFFTASGERWQINRSIRQMCVFARQNVMTDPPFARLDLISCRNMLIHCEPSVQERILPTLHYALKSTGVLLLGAACKSTDLFTVIDTEHGIFTKVTPGEEGALDAAKDGSPGGRARASEQNYIALELAQEIENTKTAMQGLMDEQEATNEELQSTNEDLVDSNEELQSLNEELQTIAEELRATNEDLSSMNEMLERQNDDLGRGIEDLTNVLTSLDLPIVTLTRDLRIGRLTPEARRVLELTRADVGRPLGDLKLRRVIPDLERVVADVLDTGFRLEREVKVGEGRSYSLRILPYRTKERRIDGVVLLFADINAPAGA